MSYCKSSSSGSHWTRSASRRALENGVEISAVVQAPTTTAARRKRRRRRREKTNTPRNNNSNNNSSIHDDDDDDYDEVEIVESSGSHKQIRTRGIGPVWVGTTEDPIGGMVLCPHPKCQAEGYGVIANEKGCNVVSCYNAPYHDNRDFLEFCYHCRVIITADKVHPICNCLNEKTIQARIEMIRRLHGESAVQKEEEEEEEVLDGGEKQRRDCRKECKREREEIRMVQEQEQQQQEQVQEPPLKKKKTMKQQPQQQELSIYTKQTNNNQEDPIFPNKYLLPLSLAWGKATALANSAASILSSGSTFTTTSSSSSM